MRTIETRLPGVLIIEPKIFGDDRGFFLESFHQQRYSEYGVDQPFVQDNMSRSYKGVLRGLHTQVKHPQGKLITVTQGQVFDVVVDINPNSAYFAQHCSVLLSGESQRQLWIPPGYAHGFYVLSESADFHYRCTDYYHPEDEAGVIWNDPDLAIEWPLQGEPLLSEKDLRLPFLKDLT